MNLFLTLAYLFFCGSCIGWVIELFFRRFYTKDNPDKKWMNPGFLVGPYLPIWGLGLCVMFSLAMTEKIIPIQTLWLKRLLLFVLMMAAMTLVEYIGGLIFVRRMNIKLWDYSNEWANLDGIICPKFSLMWAVLGAVYYFAIHPFILGGLQWLSENLAFSFVIGMFFGVFAIDLVYSTKMLAKIKVFAEENDIIVKYEELRLHIVSVKEASLEKVHFFLSLYTKTPLSDYLKAYMDKITVIDKLKKKQEKKTLRK